MHAETIMPKDLPRGWCKLAERCAGSVMPSNIDWFNSESTRFATSFNISKSFSGWPAAIFDFRLQEIPHVSVGSIIAVILTD
jgi:hypothetical protein